MKSSGKRMMDKISAQVHFEAGDLLYNYVTVLEIKILRFSGSTNLMKHCNGKRTMEKLSKIC